MDQYSYGGLQTVGVAERGRVHRGVRAPALKSATTSKHQAEERPPPATRRRVSEQLLRSASGRPLFVYACGVSPAALPGAMRSDCPVPVHGSGKGAVVCSHPCVFPALASKTPIAPFQPFPALMHVVVRRSCIWREVHGCVRSHLPLGRPQVAHVQWLPRVSKKRVVGRSQARSYCRTSCCDCAVAIVPLRPPSRCARIRRRFARSFFVVLWFQGGGLARDCTLDLFWLGMRVAVGERSQHACPADRSAPSEDAPPKNAHRSARRNMCLVPSKPVATDEHGRAFVGFNMQWCRASCRLPAKSVRRALFDVSRAAFGGGQSVSPWCTGSARSSWSGIMIR